MFYSFKGKTFGFFEWMVHPLKESMSGGSTHESGRGGGTHGGCRTPLYILRGGGSPLHNTQPLSLLLLLHLSGSGLAKPFSN